MMNPKYLASLNANMNDNLFSDKVNALFGLQTDTQEPQITNITEIHRRGFQWNNSTYFNDSATTSVQDGNVTWDGNEVFAENSTTENRAVVAFQLSVAVVVIVSNSLVVTVIIKHDTFREIKYYFVASLSVADIMLGFLYIYNVARITVFRALYKGDVAINLCRFTLGLMTMAGTASIFNLLLITLDQYFKISRPFTYQRVVTEAKAKVACSIAWLASFCMMIMNWIFVDTLRLSARCDVTGSDLNWSIFKCFVLYSTPVAMIIIYTDVFSITKRHLRQIAAQGVPAPTAVGESVNGPSQNPVNYKREAKVAMTFLIIVSFYIVSWVPYNTAVLYFICNPEKYNSTIINVLGGLISINSSVNPFVYAYRYSILIVCLCKFL